MRIFKSHSKQIGVNKGFQRYLSKQPMSFMILRLNSTLGISPSLKIKLNPNWITGFIDAEGSFISNISQNPDLKTG